MAKVYYDRTMSKKVIDEVQTNFNWVIDYVKEHNQLDFQTGSNNKSSWFSVYRGTSRVLTIKPSGKVDAAESYLKLCPDFYQSPSRELFDKLLNKVNANTKFDRYYSDAKKENKKEGYYQSLIGRRYTLSREEEDDFIIIDKEFVIGFENKAEKETWNLEIKKDIKEMVEKARNELGSTMISQDIPTTYGEFDFLALNKEGDIIIMELKQNDPTKTYLSPFQICYYKKQFEKLQDELPDLYEKMKRMIEQKRQLGILHFPTKFSLPSKLSKKIKYYLIVGEENMSDEICRRYKIIKNVVLPELEVFTCDKYGTLISSEKLH